MTDVFEAKLRKIGNSLGVIIPADIIDDLGFHRGDVVHVAIPPAISEKRNRFIMKIAGIYKKTEPFERDKEDRF